MAKLSILIGLLLSSLLATAQAIESNRRLTSGYQAQPLEQATATLTAANLVGPGTPVEYKAAQAIILQPGFQARTGSVFAARTGVVSLLAMAEGESGSLMIRAYPNPIEEATIISYVLTRSGRTSLQIRDSEGRLISRLIDGRQEDAGRHSVEWKAAGVPTGTYMCILETGTQRISRRLIRK
ncbi:T9SS type A sorting domain-containing protein [Spirosoma validum]|uniref:T9SS type A sorting domain-containing protein n=1 Tax=Spirosoma validum TaxID=2771355 RepID=A0A927B0W9_9BACT|nr:T9SS type A sorting domain-containing protein [Spirosoma validum]MBD2753515.1 T9SS type A sorting domain-containing protein [Spirosoma validum]